jgi:hypothetical protein
VEPLRQYCIRACKELRQPTWTTARLCQRCAALAAAFGVPIPSYTQPAKWASEFLGHARNKRAERHPAWGVAQEATLGSVRIGTLAGTKSPAVWDLWPNRSRSVAVAGHTAVATGRCGEMFVIDIDAGVASSTRGRRGVGQSGPAPNDE